MVKAVLFDAGNTLLTPNPSVPEVFREIASSCGYDFLPGDVEDCIPGMEQYYEDRYSEDDSFWCNSDRASMIWVEMYKVLCFELGITDDAERVSLAVFEAYTHADRWRLFPDVMPALEKLKADGYKMGIVSNWDKYLVGIIEGLGLSDYFDAVISSADVGIRKPDKEIFFHALGILGVDPAEAVHVGDHVYADAEGAKAAGIHPVLINRGENITPANIDTVESFAQLPALVSAL